MSAFEMWYYGNTPLYFPYKGEIVELVRNVCHQTDDPELAEEAAKFPLVEVITKEKPLDKMSKKELQSKADKMKIKTTGLNKSKLIEAIQAAT